MYNYDLIVIGAGSAGVRAARMAAQRGARVAVIEGAAIGGTCVNLGCIPKKLYSYAAHYGEAFQEAKGFGWHVESQRLDWALLKANRRKEISRLNAVYSELLANAGVNLHEGWATITGAHQVSVTTDTGVNRLTATHILIATGSAPAKPRFKGAELALVSDDIFDLSSFPQRVAVVGGGYIATEFASIFKGLGATVTQIHRGETILRGFDAEVAAYAQAAMLKGGIDMRVGVTVESLEQRSEDLVLTLSDGQTVSVDVVLCATGRRPNVHQLGWQNLGEFSESGGISVDKMFRTSVPSILAIGDVATEMQLTPVALAQAMYVVTQLFGDEPGPFDEAALVPTAVFAEPCIATVGLDEQTASERHERISVYVSEFRPLRHTLSASPARSLMKLIVDDSSDRVVGLHMAGDDAAEIVQGFAVAMQAGATKAMFDSTLGIHPTSAEEFCTMRTPTRRRWREPVMAVQ